MDEYMETERVEIYGKNGKVYEIEDFLRICIRPNKVVFIDGDRTTKDIDLEVEKVEIYGKNGKVFGVRDFHDIVIAQKGIWIDSLKEETKETKNLNPDVYPAAAKVAATSPRATPKDLKKKDVKISEPKQKTKENIEGTILKIMGTILLFLLIIGVLLPPLLPLMLSLMLIVFICGLIAMKSFAVLTFIGIIAGFIYIAKCQIPDYKLFDDNGNSLYDSRGNRKIS